MEDGYPAMMELADGTKVARGDKDWQYWKFAWRQGMPNKTDEWRKARLNQEAERTVNVKIHVECYCAFQKFGVPIHFDKKPFGGCTGSKRLSLSLFCFLSKAESIGGVTQ